MAVSAPMVVGGCWPQSGAMNISPRPLSSLEAAKPLPYVRPLLGIERRVSLRMPGLIGSSEY